MADIPLPEPDCRLPMDGPPRYRADQMRAHAAAQSAADNAALRAELEALRKQCADEDIRMLTMTEVDDLRAELERLTAERDALRSELADQHAHNEVLRADAERYRWLREQPIDGVPGMPVVAMQRKIERLQAQVEQLKAAHDQAMRHYGDMLAESVDWQMRNQQAVRLLQGEDTP